MKTIQIRYSVLETNEVYTNKIYSVIKTNKKFILCMLKWLKCMGKYNKL